jgi:hypothetical protein
MTKVWADPYRAHDPLVLHWLVSLGFEALLCDFAAPSPGTALASTTTVPPAQRVDLAAAKLDWENFWKGNMGLKDLLHKHGGKVCMVTPERTEITPRLVGLLQRNLMAQFMVDKENKAHQTLCICGWPSV